MKPRMKIRRHAAFATLKFYTKIYRQLLNHCVRQNFSFNWWNSSQSTCVVVVDVFNKLKQSVRMFVDYLLYGRFVDDDIAYHITCIDLNIQSDTVKP